MTNGNNISKIRYIVATPDITHFYKITDWESDMTGYGGSTSTEYDYNLVDDINYASIFDYDPTPIMQRYDKKYWKPFIVLRVEETITRKIYETY